MNPVRVVSALVLLTALAPCARAAAREGAPEPPPEAAAGSGKRILYSQSRMHVWLIDARGQVARQFPVSGRPGTPRPGTYRVFSKSPRSTDPRQYLRMNHMVRFARGAQLAIGFHGIPVTRSGRPAQRVADLGKPRADGACARAEARDARFLYEWAPIGTTVVVLP